MKIIDRILRHIHARCKLLLVLSFRDVHFLFSAYDRVGRLCNIGMARYGVSVFAP